MKKIFFNRGLFGLFLLPVLFPAIPANGQKTPAYPKNYFRWPNDLKPAIVANLGEMRNNHWHMGLDVRTDQHENVPVLAAAAGYISKIRIEKFGFGRCIFITHPNGLTTLYAHLNNFFPALEEYVTAQQYQQETWAIELDFPKDRFPVSKGQFIAYSGNTGGSQGPHTHFEIRDTKSGVCLNPLLFGMPLPDNVKPSILKLALYDRTRSIYEQATQILPLKLTDSGYTLARSMPIRTGAEKVSFAIQAIDRLTGSRNEDGIYSAELFVDEQPVIFFACDSIGYDKTRYLNAHTDYKYHFNGGPFFQHLSQLPGEHSGVYHQQTGDGVVALGDGTVHAIRIEVKDAAGNHAGLRFSVQYDPSLTAPAKAGPAVQQFVPGVVNVLERPDFELYLPETAMYDTLTSFYNRENKMTGNAVSVVHQVNDASVPVHGEMTVRIKPGREVPAEWRDRIVMQQSYREEKNLRKAEWNGEWLSAKFNAFGFYQAFIDDEPPTINAPGAGDTINLSNAKRIVFQPQDNFEVIRRFRAELDGKWLRFTNDKGRYYIYNFDAKWPNGTHALKVTVEDLAGNAITRTWWIVRGRPVPVRKAATHKKPAARKTAAKKTTAKHKK